MQSSRPVQTTADTNKRSCLLNRCCPALHIVEPAFHDFAHSVTMWAPFKRKAVRDTWNGLEFDAVVRIYQEVTAQHLIQQHLRHTRFVRGQAGCTSGLQAVSRLGSCKAPAPRSATPNSGQHQEDDLRLTLAALANTLGENSPHTDRLRHCDRRVARHRAADNRHCV